MQFSVTTQSPSRHRSDCLVLPVYAARELGDGAREVDRASRGQLAAWLKASPLDGSERRAPVTFYGLRGIQAARVVVVGLGERKPVSDTAWTKALRKAAEAVRASGAASFSQRPLCLP